MTMKQRFLWGCLAGLTIVFVKIIGPDNDHVRSLFGNIYSADVSFYLFISVITVFLGAISGLFTKEQEPVKILLFCASVPALLSTFTAEQRDTIPQPQSNQDRADFISESTGNGALGFIVSPAFADTEENVCSEGSAFSKFQTSAQNYLSGSKTAQRPYYAVVAASTKSLDKAKEIAAEIKQANEDWAPYVGCKKPGNQYYPIIVGSIGDQVSAAQLKGQFDAAGVLDQESYVSYYQYRKPIYTP